jgi:hypothetical protein
MSTWEKSLVALAAGVTCLWLTFVACWWTAAAIHLCLVPLPESLIRAAALSGLGLGCLLNVLFLPRWVKKFYTADPRWMLAVYLGLFVIAFASFMGFPIGTFLLGIVAGAYVGRRQSHRHADRDQLVVALRRTATLCAVMTAAAALPIGVLGLKEPIATDLFESRLGFDRSALDGPWGFALVGLVCLFLLVGQYFCTEIAGRLAFRIPLAGAGHGP